jgi:hypothetical protein
MNIAPSLAVKNQLLDDPSLRGLIEEATQADQKLYDRVSQEIFPAQQELAAVKSAENADKPEPDHYLASRMYTNLVYRPSIKLMRMKNSH